MNNKEFLEIIKKSFYKYLETNSQSNEKLKILHGTIAKDLKSRLGNEFIIHSLGYGDDKEVIMKGRYIDKKVDIAIEKENDIISAVALKFIMRNYAQNSNNYFENMLGETANIRATGKSYFQIVIIPSKIPYFKKDGKLDHIETITENNLSKYIKLSNDNIEEFIHTPTKTLIYLIDMPEISLSEIKNYDDYIKFLKVNNDYSIKESIDSHIFGNAVIYNDYEEFMETITNYIK